MQPLRHTFAKWCISTVPSALLTLAVALTILNFLFTSSARAEGVIYVKPGGVGAKNGVDWANAADLTTALAGASSGDELWVAAGTYKPTTTSADLRDAAFTLKAGVAVYGGFAGTETLRSQRNWATHVVILSGDLNGNDGPDFANNDENSYHVVIGATGATLDGVTITAGNAQGHRI